MRRLIRTTLALAMLASRSARLTAATVAAGNYAESSIIDGADTPPTAGEERELRLLLLQHGVTPVDHGSVELTAWLPGTDERLAVVATSVGDGEWVADVTFPTAGDWQMRVIHSVFETPPASAIRRGTVANDCLAAGGRIDCRDAARGGRRSSWSLAGWVAGASGASRSARPPLELIGIPAPAVRSHRRGPPAPRPVRGWPVSSDQPWQTEHFASSSRPTPSAAPWTRWRSPPRSPAAGRTSAVTTRSSAGRWPMEARAPWPRWPTRSAMPRSDGRWPRPTRWAARSTPTGCSSTRAAGRSSRWPPHLAWRG